MILRSKILPNLVRPVKGENEEYHTEHIPQGSHRGKIVCKQRQYTHSKENQSHEYSPNLSECHSFHNRCKQVKEKRRNSFDKVSSLLFYFKLNNVTSATYKRPEACNKRVRCDHSDDPESIWASFLQRVQLPYHKKDQVHELR